MLAVVAQRPDMRDLAIADRMQVAGRVGPVLVFGRRDHRPAPRAIARRQLVAETGPEDRPPARRPVELLVALERIVRSEEHTSELQSLMRISYAVFCLKKKKTQTIS